MPSKGAASGSQGSDAGLSSRDDRLLATFLELVRIDSPSGEESAVAEWCARTLRGLGMTVEIDESGPVAGSDTGNVIGTLPGTVPGVCVALSAHLDTVEPGRGIVPVVHDDVVSAAGDTVLGGDDKSGIAAIVEAVRRIVEDERSHAGVRVVFTTAEERGLRGAKALESGVFDGCGLCLVLDAAGEPGGIVTGAPTHFTFEATFLGKSAHAGVAPEQGISALTMAAAAVCDMHLGRLDPLSTANIGAIEGGVATNVVAPRARMTGECRSLDAERVEAIRMTMDGAVRRAAEQAGGSVEIEWTREYGGYLNTEDSAGYRLVADACADIGLAPRPHTTGGGSDANVFADSGVPVLALSCGMSDVHSLEESLRIADLVKITRLVEAVVARAAD